MTSEEVISARSLCVNYGRLRVVHDIDMSFARGSLTSIIGANGAGKTSVMLALAGALPASAGTISFGERDITGWPSHRRVRAGLAMVPDTRGNIGRLSVRANLELSRDAVPRSERGKTSALVDEQLDRFPVLRDRVDQPASRLSGGEQQMLAISRALVQEPKILLLDEPSTGLSPGATSMVFDVLRDLSAAGYTIVLVEQDVRRALEAADFTYLMDRGTVKAAGLPSEIGDEILAHGFAPTTGDVPDPVAKSQSSLPSGREEQQ